MKSFLTLLPALTLLFAALTHADEIAICGVSAKSDDGNVAANAIDGDTSTRWSTSGNSQWIKFDLCETADLSTMDIAWFKGDQRQAIFRIEVSEDDESWERVFTGYSSGLTTDFETFSATSQNTQHVRIYGFGNTSNAWNSVVDVKVFGEIDPSDYTLTAATDLVVAEQTATTATLSWTDNSTNEDGYEIQRKSTYTGNYNRIGVTTDSSFLVRGLGRTSYNEFKVLPFKGNEYGVATAVIAELNYFSDPILPVTVNASSDDGNIAENTIDGNMATRWSANGLGESIILDLGNEYVIDNLSIAWFKGDLRQTDFEISCSPDGVNFYSYEDYEGDTSSGTTADLEVFHVECDEDENIRYLKITGYGNNLNTWNSISELEVTGALTQEIQ